MYKKLMAKKKITIKPKSKLSNKQKQSVNVKVNINHLSRPVRRYNKTEQITNNHVKQQQSQRPTFIQMSSPYPYPVVNTIKETIKEQPAVKEEPAVKVIPNNFMSNPAVNLGNTMKTTNPFLSQLDDDDVAIQRSDDVMSSENSSSGLNTLANVASTYHELNGANNQSLYSPELINEFISEFRYNDNGDIYNPDTNRWNTNNPTNRKKISNIMIERYNRGIHKT